VEVKESDVARQALYPAATTPARHGSLETMIRPTPRLRLVPPTSTRMNDLRRFDLPGGNRHSGRPVDHQPRPDQHRLLELVIASGGRSARHDLDEASRDNGAACNGKGGYPADSVSSGWMLIGRPSRRCSRTCCCSCAADAVLMNSSESRVGRAARITVGLAGGAGRSCSPRAGAHAWGRLARAPKRCLGRCWRCSRRNLRFVYRSRRLTMMRFRTVVVYISSRSSFSRRTCGAPSTPGIRPAGSGAERTPHLLQVDLLYYSLITQCSVG